MNNRSHKALSVALQEQKERLVPCVHCGFCLPVCPTYVRLGDENDSPRGRLYLMRAVVEGRLSVASDAFQTHIDRCLGCRACEPACPSGVEYGVLLELARNAVFQERKARPLVRAILYVFRRKAWLRWSMKVARVSRQLGLAWLGMKLTPKLSSFHTIRFGFAMINASRSSNLSSPSKTSKLLPWSATISNRDPLSGIYEKDVAEEIVPIPPRMLRVALLNGCVQGGLFARVNDATHRVLEANGFQVVIVAGQNCCGALHTHAGDIENARQLARTNISAFTKANIDRIVVNSAGCGVALKEYGHLLAEDPDYAEIAARLSDNTRDVCELLHEYGIRIGAPVPIKATYDAACHLCHAQLIKNAPMTVLEAIPGLDITPLSGEEECCGGAGIYGLTHPGLGESIGSDKVASVIDTKADVVITANPGCIMQIGAGLLLQNSSVTAHHPIELLDESYRRAGFYNMKSLLP